MLLRLVLLMCLVGCAITTKDIFSGLEYRGDLDSEYSLWPSVHNAARLMSLRKRAAEADEKPSTTKQENIDKTPEAKDVPNPIQSEGGPAEQPPPPSLSPTLKTLEQTDTSQVKPDTTKVNSTSNSNEAVDNNSTASHSSEAKSNVTLVVSPQLDISNPGVMKRGLIVFGGFLLMAIAYFVFYRRKTKGNDLSNNGTNETNQFRYGVLQSEDRRDNLELSRIPLTMESDEDEDEDLEIFDLEQKRRSMSYVNLQTNENDNDIVNEAEDNSKDLLLDIEDASVDALINWTSNSHKSTL